MDDMVGKTCKIYIPLHQEIDMQRHKLHQSGHFVSDYASLVAAILQPH